MAIILWRWNTWFQPNVSLFKLDIGIFFWGDYGTYDLWFDVSILGYGFAVILERCPDEEET